jgi:WD40 repeat protein
MSSNIISSSNKSTERLTTFCHAEQAPNDIWQLICSHLETPQDIARIGQTNQRLFVRIFLNPSIWDAIAQKYFPDSHANSQSKATGLALCQHLTTIENNRKTGRCRIHTLVAGIEVYKIFNNLISKDQLILALDNGDIKILDLKSRKELRIHKGHLGKVNSILVTDNQLISASDDQTIKIWDLKTGKELRTHKGHQGKVKCILVYENEKKLISASSDGMIKIWNLESGQEVHTLTGHRYSVTAIVANEKQLFSASSDGMIMVWDLKNGQEIHSIRIHNGPIRTLKLYENNLISASERILNISDLENGQITTLKAGHLENSSNMLVHEDELFSGLLVHEDQLISSSRYGTIKIWDLKSKKEIRTINGNYGKVPLLIHNNLLFFGSDTSDFVNIFDVKNGKNVHTLSTSVRSLLNYKNQLIIRSWSETKIYDFNFQPLSPYSKQLVETNLAILGEIAHAEFTQNFESVEKLTQILDPNFRERLKQHAYKVGTPSTYSAAVILRVQTEVCVEALLHAIYNKDQTRISELLNQLVTIDVQNKEIFKLILQACGSVESVIWGSGELEFHNKVRLLAFFSQQIDFLSEMEEATLAFKEHLKERWGQDLPLLLADLGIISKEEYSEKLRCYPGDLQERGILSLTDLRALGILNSPRSDLQKLKVIVEEATQDRNQRRTRAFEKKKAVVNLLQSLSEAVGQKIKETNQCSALLYDGEHPWTAFQQQLSSYKKALEEECQAPLVLLEKFESYATIVDEMNGLIDAFHTLDREHQIAKLRAYVGQTYILGAWNNLRDNQDIESLAALLERRDIAPQDIFQMGK